MLAVWLLSDTVTTPAASSSSMGQQVQLGPRWPDSCRSRPLLPPRSVSRPRPPGGGGAAPPPLAPFLASWNPVWAPPALACRERSLARSLFFHAQCPTLVALGLLSSSHRLVGAATMDRQILVSSLAPLQPRVTAPFPAITLRPISFTLPPDALLLPRG